MTKGDLLNNGFEEFQGKIGTLFLRGEFFGILNKDTLSYFAQKNDMKCIGKAKTFDDIDDIEKKYYLEEKRKLQMKILLIDELLKTYERN